VAVLQGAARTIVNSLTQSRSYGSERCATRLEYRDRFHFAGEPRVAKVSELLLEGCDLIAPHIFTREDLWHSHAGMFLSADGVDRRLVQIQIDASDVTIAETEGVRRSVSLITGVQDFLEAEQTKEQQANDIVNQFNALHIASKKLFQDMITEAARKRIGLLN
jgi:hypothetical protein